MDTYQLLRTVPVFNDVRRRVRRRYHSWKHIDPSLRLAMQLVEIFFQLVLLFSWPAIILCYIPIVVTDRILHHTLDFILTYCPFLMSPADEVYEAVTEFFLSFTIGRVLVFFLLIAIYILGFLFQCFRVVVSFILFFVVPLHEDEEEPFQALERRFSHSPCRDHALGEASPSTPPPMRGSTSPPRTVLLPGAHGGPVRIVEAVVRE